MKNNFNNFSFFILGNLFRELSKRAVYAFGIMQCPIFFCQLLLNKTITIAISGVLLFLIVGIYGKLNKLPNDNLIGGGCYFAKWVFSEIIQWINIQIGVHNTNFTHKYTNNIAFTTII